MLQDWQTPMEARKVWLPIGGPVDLEPMQRQPRKSFANVRFFWAAMDTSLAQRSPKPIGMGGLTSRSEEATAVSEGD